MNAPQKILPGEAKPGVVIPIGKTGVVVKTPQKGWAAWFKKHWIQGSAVLAIGLPLAIATLYLGLIASDRYAVEVKFAVRGQETPAIDALGVFGLGGGGGMGSDSYMIVDYVRSRSMFEEVSKSVDVAKMFSASSIDWFSRLDSRQPIERIVDYWGKMINVNYEPSTSIIRVGLRRHVTRQ